MGYRWPYLWLIEVFNVIEILCPDFPSTTLNPNIAAACDVTCA